MPVLAPWMPATHPSNATPAATNRLDAPGRRLPVPVHRGTAETKPPAKRFFPSKHLQGIRSAQNWRVQPCWRHHRYTAPAAERIFAPRPPWRAALLPAHSCQPSPELQQLDEVAGAQFAIGSRRHLPARSRGPRPHREQNDAAPWSHYPAICEARPAPRPADQGRSCPHRCQLRTSGLFASSCPLLRWPHCGYAVRRF